MTTSRLDREEYLESYDPDTVNKAIKAAISEGGLSFFDDEQLEEILIRVIKEARARTHACIRSRKHYQSENKVSNELSAA